MDIVEILVVMTLHSGEYTKQFLLLFLSCLFSFKQRDPAWSADNQTAAHLGSGKDTGPAVFDLHNLFWKL